MSIDRILITGGAGFIGSHTARALLAGGYRVRALDSLDPQVHGGSKRPAYLDDEVELIHGDVRNPEAIRGALEGVDAVLHLAARVGVGQSMYEISDYTSVNALGTAVLLQELIEQPVQKLVVASSMSIYGEGLYRRADGALMTDARRTREQLAARKWEPTDADRSPLTPLPTPEDKPPTLSSIYALGKFDQERSALLFGEAYGTSTVALRLFNVYGPDQALSNPYTGVLAIFASRLLNDRRPMVFEDGAQRRDFVSVHDVARACVLALERPEPGGEVINIGSGASITVTEIAKRLAAILGKPELEPELTGKYRVGDIRHCFADISRAQTLLGYRPDVELDEGITELAGWLEHQIAVDRVEQARGELNLRGLTV